MKESPLILNAPMVLADMAGRKTQSRRPIKIRYAYPGSWERNDWVWVLDWGKP